MDERFKGRGFTGGVQNLKFPLVLMRREVHLLVGRFVWNVQLC